MTTRELKDAIDKASETEYGVAKLAATGVTTAGLAVQGSDARLTAAADLATHLADTSDAHDASAISYDPTASGLSATDAQAALDELATATSVNAAIHAATGKTTPVDADEFGLADSAASWALKKVTWANIKATAKTYFDTLYAAVSHTHAASTVTYDHTTSGLAASTVQAAVDEVVVDLASKQPLDSDLTAIAALTPANDDFMQRKAGNWTNRTPAQAKSDLAIAAADVSGFAAAADARIAAAHIDDLADVVSSSPSTGYVLAWDGAHWTPAAPGTGGGTGIGDASTNTATSVDGEMPLFSGTSGKLFKRSTLTGGLVKSTSGVPAIATADVDYARAGASVGSNLYLASVCA